MTDKMKLEKQNEKKKCGKERKKLCRKGKY